MSAWLASRRAACGVLALLAASCIVDAGCRQREPEPTTAEPVSRLSQLLRQGARRGELAQGEREEAERLVRRLLPPLSGSLAGHRWRVAYDDLPEADFVSVDLMQGEGETAPRAMWFHLFWRGNQPAAGEAWPQRLGRFPARGLEGHHLFVRLGAVELRAVADAPEYRDARRIRDVLERFDLETLARL